MLVPMHAPAMRRAMPLEFAGCRSPASPAGTAMSKAHAQTVGSMAYVRGYALVNSHDRRAGFAYLTDYAT